MTFANFLVGEGRSGEALETLPFAGHVSPYGLAWSEAIRVCASVQAGDEATAAESLAWLQAHEFDNDRALAHALLCRGDPDQLAERLIRQLQDPSQRPLALQLLQAGPATAFDELPFMKVIREREAALRAREDVREAVDAAGRIETIPVQASGLY